MKVRLKKLSEIPAKDKAMYRNHFDAFGHCYDGRIVEVEKIRGIGICDIYNIMGPSNVELTKTLAEWFDELPDFEDIEKEFEL